MQLVVLGDLRDVFRVARARRHQWWGSEQVPELRLRTAHVFINYFGTCVASKVQVVLQFGVCRGLGEVLLSILGRVYLSAIVSEFGPNRTHWLISTQLRAADDGGWSSGQRLR